MTEREYIVFLDGIHDGIYQSLTQIESFVNESYRTLQRKLKEGKYFDKYGKFRIYKLYYYKDNRKRNSNPNIIK